jgi:hypothetical protein
VAVQTTDQRLQQKRAYYRANRDKLLAQQRESQQQKMQDPLYRQQYSEKWRNYTRNNYEARLLASVKSKCKRFNIPFDLELTDIIIPSHCPKTGVELKVHTERGKFYDTPSLDRINPKGGYLKGNIQVVSLWYNIAKLNWDEDIFVDMCKKVVERLG